MAEENLHAGHRQRMFAKLNRGDLNEHELLETLLFFAIPRRNTNEIAHRLLRKFGSLAGVVNATADELAEIQGMGENSAAFLQCIGAFLTEYGDSFQRVIPKEYQTDTFISFAQKEYATLEKEVADIYLLRDNAVMYMRRRQTGNYGNVGFPTKWLQKILIEQRPTGVVIVHNHPCGDPMPSTEDLVAVEKCQAACFAADVLLCDFCIAARDGVYSFYQSGELTSVAKDFQAFNQRTKPIGKGSADRE